MLRTLLRLDPWVPRGKVWLHPALPEQIGRLYVGRIPLAGARVSVIVEGDKVEVQGLPGDLELVDAPRHPSHRVLSGSTSPGRSTPGGGVPRSRWWCRPRGRA